MGYPQAAPQQTHSKATASLICGILAFVLCGIFTAIPAIILGGQAIREIDASGGRLGGRSMANAGRILGIIGVILSIIGIVATVLILLLADSTTTTNDLSLALW